MARSWALRVRIRRLLPAPLRNPLDDVWHGARRWLRFRRADVCLVSYPKAGRTWLRLLMGRALALRYGIETDSPMEIEDLADRDRRIPRIFVTHDGIPQRAAPFEIERDKARYHTKSVLLLVRDPRDIVVSSYFHARKRNRSYDGTAAEYAREIRGGFDTVLAFYQSWRDQVQVPGRLLVSRYEDLVLDPARELERALDFIGCPGTDAATIRAAVEYGSFDNMRRLEGEGAFGVGRLEAIDPGDFDSFKVRRGKVGGYRDYLDPATLAVLDEKLARARLELFGYPGGTS